MTPLQRRPTTTRARAAGVLSVCVLACGGGFRAITWYVAASRNVEIIERPGTILQRSVDDCGIAALENVYARRGLDRARQGLRDVLHPSGGAVSMLALRDRARADGLPAHGVRLSWDALRRIPLPAIVPFDRNHFVVLEAFESDARVLFIDPAKGVVRMPALRFAERWRGMALCFGQTDECSGGEIWRGATARSEHE